MAGVRTGGRSPAPRPDCALRRNTLDARPASGLGNIGVNTIVALLDFVVYYLLGLLKFLLIVYAIMSWLIAFNVVNTYNRFVQGVVRTLERIFDPLLRPIRRIIPDMGGIDLSPMVLFLVIVLIQNYLYPAIMRDLALA